MGKGFTLIEMSIVLIIIGLIFAMAVKGKNMLDGVKGTKEAAKIVGLRNAVLAFEATHGRFLTQREFYKGLQGNRGQYEMSQLVNAGYITPDDIRQEWPTTANEDGYYILWGYKSFENSTGGEFYRLLSGALLTGVHRVDTKLVTSSYSSYNSTGYRSVSLKAICYMEIRLDDKNLGGGRGRGLDNTKPSIKLPDNCSTINYSKNASQGVNYGFSIDW